MEGSVAEALAEGSMTSWAGVTHIAASSHGVRSVSLPQWTEDTRPGPQNQPGIIVHSTPTSAAERHLRQGLDELAEYFAGARHTFSVALDLHGPTFYRQVWTEVARVPYGETRSYGEIARAIGAPMATRAVGAANGANPMAPLVPCHRIVGSDGLLHGYGPGLPLKQRLLVMEDAIPASPSDYASWVSRLVASERGGALYLGIRGAGIFCRPTCPRPVRQRYLPARVFRSAAAAMGAGFQPCAVCQPGA